VGSPAIGQGGPGRIDQFCFVDVESAMAFLDSWYWPAEEMRTIVESATFEFP
jgi:hypothetical protein